MRRPIKSVISASVILFSFIFLFAPQDFPENPQFEEISNLFLSEEVIIVFNSGGWGNTPLEEAEDFAPIIKGIQATLNEWGYNSVVIPYTRTKDDFLGKITGARDFLNSFKSSSEILAEKIEFLAEKFPDKKIIITGLSAGGALVEETIEKISGEAQVYPPKFCEAKLRRVYAIVAGIPFWQKTVESENILFLDNNGKDTLSRRELKSLVFSLVKAPVKWISAKINGQNLSFSQALHAPGHDYFWDSPEVGPEIVTFLKNRFR